MSTRQQQPSTSTSKEKERIVGIRRKMDRNLRTSQRFNKDDWNYGPLDDWGWGYCWGYRRAQYHYIERIERCLFGRNRKYERKNQQQQQQQQQPKQQLAQRVTTIKTTTTSTSTPANKQQNVRSKN